MLLYLFQMQRHFDVNVCVELTAALLPWKLEPARYPSAGR